MTDKTEKNLFEQMDKAEEYARTPEGIAEAKQMAKEQAELEAHNPTKTPPEDETTIF